MRSWFRFLWGWKKPWWKVLSDSRVRHEWECPRCNRWVKVSPAFYAGSGTPVCDICDVDMSYVRTECAI
jgi:hypothetical protein